DEKVNSEQTSQSEQRREQKQKEEEAEIIEMGRENHSDSENDVEHKSSEPKLPPPIPTSVLANINEKRGLLLPSHCQMLFVPIDNTEYFVKHIEMFQNVYGIDITEARQEFLGKAIFHVEVKPEHLLATPQKVMDFDMYTVTESWFEVNLLLYFFSSARLASQYIHVCKLTQSQIWEMEFVMDKDGSFCGFAGGLMYI
ncbi:hypothetical protein RFI_24567, partial [Reticulomyxa filosa]